MLKDGGPLRKEATDVNEATGVSRWVCNLAEGILSPSNSDNLKLRTRTVVPIHASQALSLISIHSKN